MTALPPAFRKRVSVLRLDGTWMPPTRKLNARPRKADGRAVCLYGGGGGDRLGLSRAGIPCKLFSDVQQCCIDTIKRASPGTPCRRGDMASPRFRRDVVSLARRGGRPSLVIGGPSCKGMSGIPRARACRRLCDVHLARTPRAAGLNPERNTEKYLVMNGHVNTFINTAVKVQPDVIVLENVLKLAQAPHRPLLLRAVNKMRRSGYHVAVNITNCMYYGVRSAAHETSGVGSCTRASQVPSSRGRVLVLGCLKKPTAAAMPPRAARTVSAGRALTTAPRPPCGRILDRHKQGFAVSDQRNPTHALKT